MLPPSTRAISGPLQPPLTRHVTTPLPYLAPTIKPARFRLGIMPTHCAFSKRSSGIPRSLAPMISLRTAADSRMCFSGLLSAAPHHMAVENINIKLAPYFILFFAPLEKLHLSVRIPTQSEAQF